MKHINSHIKGNEYYKFRRAIKNGADPNKPDEDGLYPIHAAIARNVGYVRELVEAGANPHQTDNESKSALQIAVCVGARSTITYLLDCGADPNYQSPDGKTVMACARNCRTEIARLLKKYGAIWTNEDLLALGNDFMRLHAEVFN